VPAPAEAATAPVDPSPAQAAAVPASSGPGFLVNTRELQAAQGGPSRARLLATDPTSAAERQARFEVTHKKCSLAYGGLFPGLGSLCAGRTTEGSLVLALGLAELGTGLTVGFKDSFSNPGAVLPLLAFGDLLTAGAIDTSLRLQRAARMPYVPPETLGEGFAAPFRPDVLSQPLVWGGILGTFAAGLLYSELFEGGLTTRHAFERPNLFGKTVNTLPGMLAGGGIGVGLFTHVALAEELAFRGLVQSGLTRSKGEESGMVLGALVFGLFHSTNALFLPADERIDYLVKGVPFITLIGGYLSYVYAKSGYTLSQSIAVHFWYDFLISAAGFVLDPKNSPLSMQIAF
jgi:membrane protease YdiL (CAAX protease family)